MTTPTNDAPVTVEREALAKHLHAARMFTIYARYPDFWETQLAEPSKEQWRAVADASIAYHRLATLTSAPALDARTLALVIAAREFWDIHNDLSDESKALDKALEPFSAAVPYADEPTSAPAGDGVEDAAWAWMDGKWEVPADRDYCADEMVDAFIAGHEAALARPRAAAGEREAEIRDRIINTPETADFMAGVPIEAAHQRERWGVSHDGGKTPFDWFWLIGYLSQKAATAQVAGDNEKALHHTISTAAALANWHAQISGRTDMRPGIGPDNGGEKPGSAYDLALALQSPPAKVEG